MAIQDEAFRAGGSGHSGRIEGARCPNTECARSRALAWQWLYKKGSLLDQGLHVRRSRRPRFKSPGGQTDLCFAVLVPGCATRHFGNQTAPEPPAWVEESLQLAVEKLAGEIGERNLYRPELVGHAAEQTTEGYIGAQNLSELESMQSSFDL